MPESISMNNRERVFAALSWEAPDIVPFVPKSNHVPRNMEKLKRLKDIGMGLSMEVGVFEVQTPNVTTRTQVVDDFQITTYHTPVGEVSTKVRINLPSEGGERETTWVVEHMFKKSEDYKVIKFIIEDKIYKPNYSEAVKKEKALDEDGVVFTSTGYSPLMQLIAENYMGFQRLAVELSRRPSEVETLMEAMDAKFEEQVRIVANSPIKLVHVCGNIDGVLVNPRIFKKYIIPRYQKYNEILHRSGKITMTHMDGRLKCLKELIRETGLDTVEAFTPPPGGDLPLKEARAAWDEDLAIWVNIPEVTFYYEPSELECFIRTLLTEASPGNGLVLGITETVPPSRRDSGLEIITKSVQKYGRCPIPAG